MGVLPHSSLYTEDGSVASFTVDDLIKRSTHTKDLDGRRTNFTLHSSMAVDAMVMSDNRGDYDAMSNAL